MVSSTSSSTTSKGEVAAIPGCAEVSNGRCTKCALRFYSNNGVCQAVSDLCKSWSLINGACSDCYTGYELSAGACVLSKQVLPVQPQPGSGPAPIAGCAQQKDGVCTGCSFRYYLSAGACLPVSDLCNTWAANGACLTCYTGYELSAGACVLSKQVLPVQGQPGSGPAPIAGCAQQKDGVCTGCSFRYYLSAGACLPVSDLCNTWAANGACLTCYTGYELSAGACVLSKQVLPVQGQPGSGPAPIAGCAQQKDGVCTGCSFRYYLSAGACLPVSDLCNTWAANGACLTCYTGYELSAGACVLSKQVLPVQPQPGSGPAPIAGCAQQKDGVCTGCSFRYYLSAGACLPVSDLCKSWSLANGACTECYTGYELSAGACILSKQVLPVQPQPGTGPAAIAGCAQHSNGVCVKCAFRYYKSNGACVAVSDQCKTWSEIGGACI